MVCETHLTIYINLFLEAIISVSRGLFCREPYRVSNSLANVESTTFPSQHNTSHVLRNLSLVWFSFYPHIHYPHIHTYGGMPGTACQEGNWVSVAWQIANRLASIGLSKPITNANERLGVCRPWQSEAWTVLNIWTRRGRLGFQEYSRSRPPSERKLKIFRSNWKYLAIFIWKRSKRLSTLNVINNARKFLGNEKGLLNINPLCPCVTNSSRIAKISILK